MGGGVEGGAKSFSGSTFQCTSTIVPPTKAFSSFTTHNLQTSQNFMSWLTASNYRTLQRMQHWSANIYSQFHGGFSRWRARVLCSGELGSVLSGKFEGVGRGQENERPESWWWVSSAAWQLPLHGKNWLRSSAILRNFSLSLTCTLVHLVSGYLKFSVSTSEKYMKLFFLLKMNFQLVQRIWNERHILQTVSIFIIIQES